MKPQKTPDHPYVGGFKFVGIWEGPRESPGIHLEIECELCQSRRTVARMRWNAAHTHGQGLRCSTCVEKKRQALLSAAPRARLLRHNNVSQTPLEWAKQVGVPVSSIYYRLNQQRRDPKRFSDTDVIFGLTTAQRQANTIHKQDFFHIEKALDSLRSEIRAQLERAARDSTNLLVDGVLRLVLERLQHQGKIDLTQFEPSAPSAKPATTFISAGVEFAMDVHHNPAIAHPMDAERVFMDATFRQFREEFGDYSATGFLEDAQWMAKTKEERGWLFGKPEAEAEAPKEPEAPKESEATILPFERKEAKPSSDPLLLRPYEPHKAFLYHETMYPARLPKPLPEGLTPQEETTPITYEEAKQIISAPWWFKHVRWDETNDWFDPIQKWSTLDCVVMLTQYERMVDSVQTAPFPTWDTQEMLDASAMVAPFTWTTDHQKLNAAWDFILFRQWLDADLTREQDLDVHAELIIERINSWLDFGIPAFSNMVEDTAVNRLPLTLRRKLYAD